MRHQWHKTKWHVSDKIKLLFRVTKTWSIIFTILWDKVAANPLSVEIDHDDVIKWKHFPLNWPFVRGIHWSPVNSPHKGQWRGALMFSLICTRINGWVNNREAGDLRRHRAHYDVTVMYGNGSHGAVPSCKMFYGPNTHGYKINIHKQTCLLNELRINYIPGFTEFKYF